MRGTRHFIAMFVLTFLLTLIVWPTPAHAISPAQRIAAQRVEDVRRFTLAYENWLEGIFETAHPAPSPVSSSRCPVGLVGYEIESVFGWAAPWAESIAFRESRCTGGALNQSGSSGVFQILMPMNARWVAGACPGRDPTLAVFDADCNIRAAWAMFLDQGAAPWRL